MAGEGKMHDRIYRGITSEIVTAYRSQTGFFTYLDDGRPEMTVFEMTEKRDKKSAFRIAYFFSSFLRGTIATGEAAFRFMKMAREHKLLEPSRVISLGEEKLMQYLEEARFGYASKSIAKFWIVNAKIIEQYGDEPWRCLDGVTNYHQALYRLGGPRIYGYKKSWATMPYLGTKGFGTTGKVTALFLQMLMDLELIEWFPLPVAVDFHFVQICLATRAYDPEGIVTYYTISGRLREESMRLAPKGDPHFNGDLSAATYVIGSRLCRRQPQMTANPIVPEERRKGSGAYFVPICELIDNPRRNRSKGVCGGNCPVEKSCKDIVPSGPYHQHGYLGKPIDLWNAVGDTGIFGEPPF